MICVCVITDARPTKENELHYHQKYPYRQIDLSKKTTVFKEKLEKNSTTITYMPGAAKKRLRAGRLKRKRSTEEGKRWKHGHQYKDTHLKELGVV